MLGCMQGPMELISQEASGHHTMRITAMIYESEKRKARIRYSLPV